jgi:hypothetical protein
MKHGEWKAGLTYVIVMAWLIFRMSTSATVWFVNVTRL